MNEWNRIWAKRSSEIDVSDDIFDMFCKLKKQMALIYRM